MRVNDTSSADQLIKIFAQSAKTNQEISTAILKKQQEVAKSTGNAIISLLESSVELADSGSHFDATAYLGIGKTAVKSHLASFKVIEWE